MGYTHYWSFNKSIGIAAERESKYQSAIKACNKVIKHYYKFTKGTDESLSGYSAHCKNGQYGGVNFNGCRGNDHETFCLREHFNESDGDFCKTAQKPYDQVVVACLIVLQHYLGDAIEISSDGTTLDWMTGLNLAQSVLKRNFKIPKDVEIELSLISG